MQYSVTFTRDVCAKFDIHNSPQSPGIGQNSDGGNSNFRISGLSLIKRNCRNSRTSDDIDKRLGPVTKLDKRNKTTSKKKKKKKKMDDEVMSEIILYCQLFKLQPIWSNTQAGFQVHSL